MDLTPRLVLSFEKTKPIKNREFVIGHIRDVKKISILIKLLEKHFPLNGYYHLRRIRKIKNDKDELETSIILFEKSVGDLYCKEYCKQHCNDNECVFDKNCISFVYKEMMKKLLCIEESWIDEIQVINLPSSPPLIRFQYEEMIKVWPVVFREDKNEALMIRGDYFDKNQLETIEFYMKLAIEQAYKKPNQQSFSTCGGFGLAGIVIVDPKENNIIAMSTDENYLSPASILSHASLNALAIVSRNQILSKTRDQYLCTGFDVYITKEPCTMCSMALLHSRVSKVFYGVFNEGTGALGSIERIHTHTPLNHKFQVFSNVLNQECSILHTLKK